MKGGSHKPTELPYQFSSEGEFQSTDYLYPGGDCVYGKASQTLNVGDVVFYSAQNTWNKAVGVANYATYVGVVVGGFRTGYEIIQDDSAIGVLQAAQANEGVIVMTWGVAKVVSDAAFAVAAKVSGAATTAGRVQTVGGATGNWVGVALDVAGGAGVVIRLAVNAAG